MATCTHADDVRRSFATLNGMLNATAWHVQLAGQQQSKAPTPDAAFFKRKAAIRANQEARDNKYR